MLFMKKQMKIMVKIKNMVKITFDLQVKCKLRMAGHVVKLGIDTCKGHVLIHFFKAVAELVVFS